MTKSGVKTHGDFYGAVISLGSTVGTHLSTPGKTAKTCSLTPMILELFLSGADFRSYTIYHLVLVCSGSPRAYLGHDLFVSVCACLHLFFHTGRWLCCSLTVFLAKHEASVAYRLTLEIQQWLFPFISA